MSEFAVIQGHKKRFLTIVLIDDWKHSCSLTPLGPSRVMMLRQIFRTADTRFSGAWMARRFLLVSISSLRSFRML